MAEASLIAALTAHAEALRLNTEASNRSAAASNQLSEKVDRLSGELHELRARVETIEDAKHIEEEVAKRLGVLEDRADPKSFLEVFKSPVVILGLAALLAVVLMFAIARDPSTAHRVVEKVPTRQEVSK